MSAISRTPSRLSSHSSTSPIPPGQQPSRITASSTLIIENFSQLADSHKGTALSTRIPNSKHQYRFYFAVHPKNSFRWVSNDVFVCLFFYDVELTVHYKVSILDAKKEKLYCQEYAWKKHNKSGHHAAKFISRDELLEVENGFLNNDKLTICCEVEVLGETNPCPNNIKLISSMSHDYEVLFQKSQHSDLLLLVGGKEFLVHKAILSARSPVFERMFNHDTKENQEGVLEITDVESDVCEQMLRFIYSDKVDSNFAPLGNLLAAADKYQLDSLKNYCAQCLASTLTIESVSHDLLLADMHRALELKARCIDFITDHMAKVKDTKGWQIVTKERPELGLELLLNLSTKHDQLKSKN